MRARPRPASSWWGCHPPRECARGSWLHLFGDQRQCHRKRAAFPGFALDADRAALQIHDLTRQRQPQPRAFVAARHTGFELFELREKPLEVLWFDADASILDREVEAVRFVRGGKD